MHIMPPHINNIGSTKKKPNAKQLKAKAEHEAWLKKMGINDLRPTNSRKLVSIVKSDKTGPQCSNQFDQSLGKKSVFDSQWKKIYDDPVMAERERIALIHAEAKKSRVVPLFNKGGLQVASENEDLTKIGSLSKR